MSPKPGSGCRESVVPPSATECHDPQPSSTTVGYREPYLGFHPQTKSNVKSAARVSGAGDHLGFGDPSTVLIKQSDGTPWSRHAPVVLCNRMI
jgi:hypothetical protein